MSISLQKGQKISLSKNGNRLRVVEIGLGWAQRIEKFEEKVGGFLGFGGKIQIRTQKEDVDLDASCILYDASKTVVDTVFFQQLKSKDGSIVHSGDDRAGGGADTDPNETIIVDLEKVPKNVQSIVFVVNSYSGETFRGIPSAFCNILDKSKQSEFARYDLVVSGGDVRGFIVAKVYRHNGEWKFHAIGETASGTQRTVRDIEPQARIYA